MAWQAERYHDISCGHRVHNQGSKCELLHGHNYRVHFHCAADQLNDTGMVIDFGVMKSQLCMWIEEHWDHKFLAWEQDPVMLAMHRAVDTFGEDTHVLKSLVWVPFNPTAENMAQYLVDVVGPMQLQGTGVKLVKVIVEETRKCSASYHAETH